MLVVAAGALEFGVGIFGFEPLLLVEQVVLAGGEVGAGGAEIVLSGVDLPLMILDLDHRFKQLVLKLALVSLERREFVLQFLQRLGTGDPAAVEVVVGRLRLGGDRLDLQIEIAGAGLRWLDRLLSGGELLVGAGDRFVAAQLVGNRL